MRSAKPLVVRLAAAGVVLAAVLVGGFWIRFRSSRQSTLSDDIDIFAAALEHFGRHENWLARKPLAKTLIVVDQQTIGPYPFALPWGAGRNASLLPEGNYWDLKERNTIRVSLGKPALGKEVVVMDLGQFPLDFGNFEEAVKKKYLGIEATSYVQLWLPGYSSDGKTAVLRFAFGPSSHGASATYLMTNQGGRWIVSDYDLAYFL